MEKSDQVSSTEQLLWTARQVASALGISERYLYKLHSKGQLPQSIQLGRSVRWRKAEIEAWLKSGAPSRPEWERKKKSI